jgi:hypothetical protein
MAGEAKIQRFMLWDEPRPKLSDFIGFSAGQLKIFAEFVDKYGFDATLGETLGLASSLGVSHERALDLLRYAELLDDQKEQLGLTPEDVIGEFRTYLEHKAPPLVDKLPALQPALVELFKNRPDVRLRSKRRMVSSGIIPSATAFESLCDLRPVFNDPRDKILDYVSIALIRIRTQSDRQESNDDLIFQIDKSGLDRLEKFMERLRKKFAVIEQTAQQLLEGAKR